MASNPTCSRLEEAPLAPAPNWARAWAFLGSALAPILALSACQPNLQIGKWTCSEDGAADTTDINAPVAIPWTTGFENGFCDYAEVAGFCYAFSPSNYEIVTSPVHTGQYAAAFSVDSTGSGNQARCVRQGALPRAAYYGAWYYVPTNSTNNGNWNLFHFTGGTDLTDDAAATSGRLDLSLVSAKGGLQVVVYGLSYENVGASANYPPVPIPIGAWFHLQLYIDREPNGTGEIRLYQDGQQVFDATNVATDVSPLGQWYVGNLADSLIPAHSTLYVDDITISAAR